MTRRLDGQPDHLLWKQIVDKEDKVSFISNNSFVAIQNVLQSSNNYTIGPEQILYQKDHIYK